MIYFPRRWPPMVGTLIVATLAVSIVAALLGDALYQQLALEPAAVWRGEVWRLATWWLVERSPFALVFACVTLYWFGGDLVGAWGRRDVARYVIAIVLIAGAGTSIIALALPSAWRYPHLGGWALGDALVIAWALQFPARQIRIYGLFSVGGEVLAYGTVGITALFAIFYGPAPFLPELLAGAAALLHMTGTWRRWRRELERRYRRRHLRVVRN